MAMIKKMFLIKDVKGGICHDPFLTLSEGEAVRAFSDVANDTRTAIGQHPEDYCLYYIGDYDVISGEITEAESIQSFGLASNFVKVKSENVIKLEDLKK